MQVSEEAKLLAALEEETQVTPDKWRRLSTLPLDLQKLDLAEYVGQDWTDPATPAGQRALAILAALGNIGSAVGTVAGAIAGVKGVV